MNDAKDAKARMWRIVRTERPGWEIASVAATAGTHRATVLRYCQWLESQGFIARCGKRGCAFLFRVTQKGVERRDAPCPPTRAHADTIKKRLEIQRVKSALHLDPERSAVCLLTHIFLRDAPEKWAADIVAACEALIKKFKTKKITQPENGGKTA